MGRLTGRQLGRQFGRQGKIQRCGSGRGGGRGGAPAGSEVRWAGCWAADSHRVSNSCHTTAYNPLHTPCLLLTKHSPQRTPRTWVAKQTLSAPRTAMAVRPLLLAALKAYSTWYSRPSGEKMVLQEGTKTKERKLARCRELGEAPGSGQRVHGGRQAGTGGAAPGLHRCSHVAVVAAAAAARHLHRGGGGGSNVRPGDGAGAPARGSGGG